MESNEKTLVTVQVKINVPVKEVWKFWTTPEAIVKWNNASDDWHTTHAINDLRVGGKFNFRMEAKDGSEGFDFGGAYNKVNINELIEYTLEDDRKVKIIFTSWNQGTQVVESFEAEDTNTIELQRGGWQSILNNFKKFAESN